MDIRGVVFLPLIWAPSSPAFSAVGWAIAALAESSLHQPDGVVSCILAV